MCADAIDLAGNDQAVPMHGCGFRKTVGEVNRYGLFNTEWPRQLFPPEFVQAKIKEAKQLLRLLQSDPSSQF